IELSRFALRGALLIRDRPNSALVEASSKPLAVPCRQRTTPHRARRESRGARAAITGSLAEDSNFRSDRNSDFCIRHWLPGKGPANTQRFYGLGAADLQFFILKRCDKCPC